MTEQLGEQPSEQMLDLKINAALKQNRQQLQELTLESSSAVASKLKDQWSSDLASATSGVAAADGTGQLHHVAVGEWPFPACMWVTSCGWKFAKATVDD